MIAQNDGNARRTGHEEIINENNEDNRDNEKEVLTGKKDDPENVCIETDEYIFRRADECDWMDIAYSLRTNEFEFGFYANDIKEYFDDGELWVYLVN